MRAHRYTEDAAFRTFWAFVSYTWTHRCVACTTDYKRIKNLVLLNKLHEANHLWWVLKELLRSCAISVHISGEHCHFWNEMSPNRLSTLAPCEQEAFLAPSPLVRSWLSAVGLLMKDHAKESVNSCSLKTLLQSKSPHTEVLQYKKT